MPTVPANNGYLTDFLEYRAGERPEQVCWSYAGKTTTWSEAWTSVRHVAGALSAEGIRRHDTVAFLDKNNTAIMRTTFGASLLGAVHAVINWRLAPDEIAYAVNHSAARILFVGHQFARGIEAIRELLPKVEKVIVVGGDHDEFEPWAASAAPMDRDPAITENDVCVLMYSSGTSGRPKGVQLTQRNLIEHSVHGIGTGPYDDGDMLLITLPMFHVSGTAYSMFGPATGIGGYILPEVDLDAMAEGMRQGATHMFVVPTVLAAIMQAGPSVAELFAGLKVLMYGAAPMPPPLLREALAAWPNTHFMQVYGMTECCGVVTVLDDAAHRDPEHPERLVSAGRAVPGVEVKIVDEESGEDVPLGGAGEIWLRTRQSTPGYRDDAGATEKLLTADGWVRTGDLGRLDDEGFVFVEDRLKDMIISGGENVYSSEVERVLAEHPDLREVAVIGVPDPRWGEAVKAVVVAEPGSSVDPELVRTFARERLAGYKVPKSIVFVEALPRNASGKILKRELRAQYKDVGRAASGV